MLQTTTYKKTPNFFGVNYTKKVIATKVRINYTTFGSILPGRNFSSNAYKYGFGGKIKDDEIEGNGNSYDFGARQNDPRLGRWWSTDPKGYKYPYLSPYVAFGNSPNYYIDPGGETLRVAITGNVDNDFKAKRDIENLLPDGKSSLITFGDDGTVKFTITMEQAKAMAVKDPGIGLVYDLVTVKETIVYEVNESSTALVDGKPVTLSLFAPVDVNTNPPSANNLQVDNQSFTSRETPLEKDRLPIDAGVDGKVVIDPYLSYIGNEDGSGAKKNRESIVFHELSENLERTSGKNNYDTAHQNANNRQDKMESSDRRRDGKSGTASLMKNANYSSGNDGKNKTSKPIKTK